MKVNCVQIELRTTYSFDYDGPEYIYQPSDAQPLFALKIGKCNIEYVGLICLDHTHRIVNYSNVAIGGTDSVITSVSQIIKVALLSNASSIVIAHNHPSGVLEITSSDVSITRRIAQAAHLVGISLMDSLVVNSGGEYMSIRSKMKDLNYE